MHNDQKVPGLRTEGCTDNGVQFRWYVHILLHMNPLRLFPLMLVLRWCVLLFSWNSLSLAQRLRS